MSDRHNGVVMGELVVLNPARLDGREEHRGSGENLLAITLHEVRGRRADRKDEVGGSVCIDGVEIIHERSVCFVVVQPGVQQRVVVKIHWALRFAGYSRTNELRVVGPWFEAKPERVQHQNSFWLDLCPTARRRRQGGCHRERNNDGHREKITQE